MSPKKKFWLYTLVGVSGGAAVGAGWSYYQIQQARVPVLNQGSGTVGTILTQKPDVKVSRKVWKLIVTWFLFGDFLFPVFKILLM